MKRVLHDYGAVFALLVLLAVGGVIADGAIGLVAPAVILVTAPSLSKLHSGRWFP